MPPDTCKIFSANVRWSFCTLKSYLFSGKSWAISISLPPTSFHARRMSSEGESSRLGESLGGDFFCARRFPANKSAQHKKKANRILFRNKKAPWNGVWRERLSWRRKRRPHGRLG